MSTDTGSRFAALRATRGLTQEQLAAQLGVSRQAISNWERSESLPDTANLVRLSELYEVTLDDLLGRTSLASDLGRAAAHGSTKESRVRKFALPLTCVALSAVYYFFFAQPLLVSTIFDLTEVFGLGIGPSLAVLWIAAEVLFVLLPFALTAAVPVNLPRRIWLAPLAVFLTIPLASLGYSAFSGASVIEYAGIGGALMSSVAIKTDVLSLVVGCTLVDMARRRAVAERPL